MKKKHHAKKARKSRWNARSRKVVENFREAERKQRERFWKGMSSLDYDVRSPRSSDLGAGVDNIVDQLDYDILVEIEGLLEKMEREQYERAIEAACEIVTKFAPHCLDSLKDFIENGGDREATICAIRQRMINREQYQNRKRKNDSDTRSGRPPQKCGDATAAL